MPLPRYLRPEPGQGKFWVMGIIFGLIVTTYATWFAYQSGNGVGADNISFTVPDSRTATLTFSVTKPTDLAVVCTIQAQDINHAVVGTAQVKVPPAATKTTVQTGTVKTTTEAVAVLVHDCVRAP
jgi:hypothetical protein